MSTVRNLLDSFLSTREGSKQGTASAIEYASALFGQDDAIRPNNIRGAEQKPRVAVTNYGGFIKHHYGISATHIVENWGNTISVAYGQLDNVWETLDTEEFSEFMDTLTDELLAQAVADSKRDALIGKPAEKLASSMLKATKGMALIASNKGHFSALALVTMRDTRDALNAQLSVLENTKA